MAGSDTGGSRGRGGRPSWTRRALVTASVVPLGMALSLTVGEPASAPGGVLELFTAVGEPAPPAEYPTITAPDRAVPGTGHVGESVALSASPADIPDVALAAYHRAATVINATDKSCRLSWSVIAAIGRVESDHGQYAGSSLNQDGVATPPIIGARLDGRGGTTRIRDTDAGDLDGDQRFDRAVGPMQFIPSTWSYVGVDGDSDGRRDPQDIDDSALSTAVYLCVGKGDLSTTPDLRRAVHRYNHSERYVDLVLAIADAYAAGDAWAVTGGTVPAGTVQTRPTNDLPVPVHTPHPQPSPQPEPQPTPVTPATPEPSPATPIQPTAPAVPNPTLPPPTPPGEVPVPEEPPPPVEVPVPNQQTPAEEAAAALCTELGYVDDPADPAEPFDTCVALAVAQAPADATEPPLTLEQLVALLLAAGVPVPTPPAG